ncbi:heterogeneous nuclear ribonucleoprotein 1-like [Iris pallida]|uniref:Heterogeneous nuclear ribonucleoprotein 1-like n=1 Tax=Iris pallida TaxID=29817 RepID=A0AAX6FL21_IRIPA|nr:heterogeneous nuclear ribonucleoprotein 1-like [Iris pallida]
MDSDQGKLFIGGISWETSEERLSEYFGKYGQVLSAVIMKDKMTDKPRGFGFVAFADPSVLDAVLQDKHTIDGRTVEAKRAMSREEQQNSRSANSNVRSSGGGDSGNTRTKKIFVGGLPPTITEEGLSQYFQTYGNVTDVVVMYDQTTQRPRGFGFISFDTEDAVDQVLHKTFHELDGKLVEVKRALPKDANPNSGGSARPMDGGSYQSYGASGANTNSYDGRTASGYMQPQAPGGNYSTYGSSGYGASGYGYGSNNTAGYGASGYGSVPAGAYGNPSATAIGYGSGHTGGPRSSWNNQAPTSYGSGGYGANTGYGAAATWNAPAGGGGNSVPTSQTPGGTTGYGNPTYGYGAYGGTEGSYGNQSSYGAVGPRGGAPVGGTGEQGTAYSQPWRSDSSQGGGYGAGQMSGPTSYGGAYGSASRQPQQ